MHFNPRNERLFHYFKTPNFKSIVVSFLLILTLLAVSSQTGKASTGALDLTFGTVGLNVKELGADAQETRAVAIQADGKIVLVGKKGNFSPISYDFLIMRYNADGSIDTGFGTNGVVITDFGGENEIANAVAIQSDGKIVVAGGVETQPGSANFKAARYLSDGSLDTSFGSGGKISTGILDHSISRPNMVLQSDGKILLASGETDLLMIRLNGNGSLDSSFGTGGQVVFPNRVTYAALGVQSNGKIIVAGLSNNNTESVVIYGFNADGSPNTSFGVNGKFTRAYVRNNILYNIVSTRMAIQSDDKIIVSGHFNTNSQSHYYNILPPLIKLNADGSTDSGFAPNTTNVTPTTPCNYCTSEVRKILPMADGRFYTIGFSGDNSMSFRGISISRYLADGSFDNSFGFHGTRYLRKVDWTYSVESGALQPDGKIIVGATGSITLREDGGQISSKYLLIRLNPAVSASPRGDFDGDGKTDFAVWRPSDRTWYLFNSSNGSYSTAFYGISTDKVIAEDYNYDGKTDIAVYRPANSTWWINSSQPGNGIFTTAFGAVNDITAPADYDGDGLTDNAVFRPSNGTWYVKLSSLSLNASYVTSLPFGLNGDKPVPADYDGDGLADIAVFRPSSGTWWVMRSSDNQVTSTNWGISTDIPVQADYDGDNKTDIGVFRDGVWYVYLSSNGTFAILQWGLSGDIPVPGDYDGDIKTDFAIFRPSEGNWYVYRSSDASYSVFHWGQAGDIPIPAR